MTGRYTFRTGAMEAHDGWIRWRALDPEEVTFAELLREAGYATAVAGKWHVSLLRRDPAYPQQKGFDRYSLHAWHEGPRYFAPWIWRNGTLLREERSDAYGPDLNTDFLIDFMAERREEPFLAYYPMTLPHLPSEYDVPGPEGHKTYAQMVEYADLLVGRLIKALDDLGLRENTLVLFTSDNGSPRSIESRFQGQLVTGGKRHLDDRGTHVPFLASWKGTTPRGAVSHDLVDFSDLLPTLVELADARLPADRVIDGRSFAPQLQGRPGSDPREWVFSEWQGRGFVRDARWKLYTDGTFYDLSADPGEETRLEPPLPPEAETARAQLQGVLQGLGRDRSDRWSCAG